MLYSKFLDLIFRSKLSHFLNDVQHKSSIEVIKRENGNEFIMPKLYASKGISHQTRYVESPQQNRRVERKINISGT